MVQPLWETIWQFLKRLHIEFLVGFFFVCFLIRWSKVAIYYLFFYIFY